MIEITNSEFTKEVLNIFDKIKTDQRDFLSITCVDDIDGKFVIEIGQTFDHKLNCFSVKLEIYKYRVLQRFTSITNFIIALYYQYRKLDFVNVMKMK